MADITTSKQLTSVTYFSITDCESLKSCATRVRPSSDLKLLSMLSKTTCLYNPFKLNLSPQEYMKPVALTTAVNAAVGRPVCQIPPNQDKAFLDEFFVESPFDRGGMRVEEANSSVCYILIRVWILWFSKPSNFGWFKKITQYYRLWLAIFALVLTIIVQSCALLVLFVTSLPPCF